MGFELQPILEGELVRLRPLCGGDWEELYAAASDPLIWEQHPVRDRWTEDGFGKYFRSGLESGGALVVIDRANGRIIGASRFNGYNEAKSEIEIGWTFLTRAYWGGVYNREVKRLMLRHAFGFVRSVVFLVGPGNLRSQKAMEKIGGVRDGVRVDGNGVESFVFRIETSM